MARNKAQRTKSARQSPADSAKTENSAATPSAANPPRRRLGFLVPMSVLMAIWVVFLLIAVASVQL
jgi:hypothetical protein